MSKSATLAQLSPFQLKDELIRYAKDQSVIALLMGAIAGARQNTTSMRAAQKESRSACPGLDTRCRSRSPRSFCRSLATSSRCSREDVLVVLSVTKKES